MRPDVLWLSLAVASAASKSGTTENSHRGGAHVRDRQDLWLLQLIDRMRCARVVVVGCVHTLPRSPGRDRGKHSRRRQPSSTNNSRRGARAGAMVRAAHFSAPHVRFQSYQSSVGCLAAAKLESLLEFLVLEKYARVSLKKKDEAHFADLVIGPQEIPDRRGRNFSRFNLWITEGAGGNGRKRNRRKVV